MKYCKYLVLLLFLLLCPFFVSAQDNAISQMIVKEVSGSTVAGATTISGNTVTPNIDFYEVGDSVSYQLFVNYDSSKYKISYVSDNNKNRYVKTSYGLIDDKIFMTITYPKKIATGYGVDPFKIFVKLQYKDGKPIIPDDVLIPPGFVNPPTGLIIFIIFCLLVIGSGVLSYIRKKKYYLLLIFLIPFMVYAKQSDTIEVNLNTDNVNIAYRVSFNGNGATGSMLPITCFVGQSCQLPENQYTRELDIFLGWSKSPTGTATYTNAQDVSDFGTPTTLYAVWQMKYIVHYNGNGATSGSMSDTLCLQFESCTLNINSFEKTEYSFGGWATSPTGSVSYEDGGTYTNIATSREVTLYAYWYVFSSKDFDFTGSAQTFRTSRTGNYKLEVWGAQGGYRSSSSYGGKGGYSYGEVTLSSGTVIYVYVGGAGGSGSNGCGSTICAGGFNGGGYRYKYYGGGGASDIRIGQDSLYARVIVAGGGGSDGASNKMGMYGGGTSGGSSTESYTSNSNYCGKGGTQTYSGYSSSYTISTQATTGLDSNTNSYYCGGFGFGGGGVFLNSGYGGAGGGGWYGGSGNVPDGSADDDRGGGGGSGYVYTSSTATNYPGSLLNSSYYLTNAQTIAGNTSFTSPTGGTETGHSGNGYARITYVE